MSDWGVPNWRDQSAYLSPKKPLEHWRWQFTRRRPDYREEWRRGGFEGLRNKFGYTDSHDPRKEQPLYYAGPLLQILEVKDDQDQAFETVALTGPSGRISNHLVKVPFDLDRPLSAQVESAAKALRSLQEQLHGKQLQRRLHREKWPLYLRVIDARDAGETWETIGRELLKRDPDSISEDLPVDEFDRQIDRSGNTTAARARQVWEQAQVLMFNFPN